MMKKNKKKIELLVDKKRKNVNMFLLPGKGPSTEKKNLTKKHIMEKIFWYGIIDDSGHYVVTSEVVFESKEDALKDAALEIEVTADLRYTDLTIAVHSVNNPRPIMTINYIDGILVPVMAINHVYLITVAKYVDANGVWWDTAGRRLESHEAMPEKELVKLALELAVEENCVAVSIRDLAMPSNDLSQIIYHCQLKND